MKLLKTKLNACILLAEFPEDLKELFQERADYPVLNGIVENGLLFQKAGERIDIGEYGLLIEDHVGNIADFITNVSDTEEVRNWIICNKISVAYSFMQVAATAPLIVGLDFDLDKKPVIDTQKLYEALKTHWVDVPVIGITQHEKNEEKGMVNLKNAMRSKGDSVYLKGDINKALPNILRDKIAISKLRSEVRIVKTENNVLVEKIRKINAEKSEAELILKYSGGMNITSEILNGFQQTFEIIRNRFRIYGNHTAFKLSIFKAHRFANIETAIAIFGQSGSGKESVANIIHQFSKRKHSPFITIDCGRLDGETVDSELFGHKKGSFTGATDDKKGFVKLADKGTLFLDEIQNLPSATQNKLLRYLTTKRFFPKGDDQETTSDVRIIVATSFTEEQLREVLVPAFFYRIVHTKIIIPSINERGTDKLVIARQLLSDLNDENRTSKRFSQDAEDIISQTEFEGNVRELKSVVETAFHNSLDSNEISAYNLSLNQISTKEQSAEFIELNCSETKKFLDQIETLLNNTPEFANAGEVTMEMLAAKFPAKSKKNIIGVSRNTFDEYLRPHRSCIKMLIADQANWRWHKSKEQCQFIRTAKSTTTEK